MKNLYKTIAIVTLLVISSPVLADEATSTPSVEEATSTPVVQHINFSNGDPMKVTNVWGLTGYQTPIVPRGTVVTDTFGIKSTCPYWFNVMGCFNLTTVKYYVDKMIAGGFKEIK